MSIAVPDEADIPNRLETVLTTLYLLFNEGYYSESHPAVLRKDLCLEAMRLTYLLVENEQTNQPRVQAPPGLRPGKMRRVQSFCTRIRTKTFGMRN